MDKLVNELHVFGNYYEQMLHKEHKDTREWKQLTHKVNVYYHKYYDYYYDVLAVNVYKLEGPDRGPRRYGKIESTKQHDKQC